MIVDAGHHDPRAAAHVFLNDRQERLVGVIDHLVGIRSPACTASDWQVVSKVERSLWVQKRVDTSIQWIAVD